MQGVVSFMKLDSTPPTPASIVLPCASEERKSLLGMTGGRPLGDELKIRKNTDTERTQIIIKAASYNCLHVSYGNRS